MKIKDERFTDKKKYSLVRMYIRLSKKIFKFAPVGLCIFLLAALLHGVGNSINVIAQQYFFDTAGNLFNNTEQEALKAAFIALLIYVSINILMEILNSFINLYFTLFSDRMNGLNQRELNMKLSRLSPIQFEDTQVLDDIEKASQGMYSAIYIALICLLYSVFYHNGLVSVQAQADSCSFHCYCVHSGYVFKNHSQKSIPKSRINQRLSAGR